jgi:hypothetical protein
MILNLYITYETLLEKDIRRDLILRAKNSNIISCYFYDEDDLIVDITGDTIFFTVKNKPSDVDNDAVLKKTITSLTNPQSGNCEIELTNSDTSSLLGNYIYDIKIKHGTKFYTVSEGNVCFKSSLTIRES